MGEIRTIKDLERAIGIILYARRCVKDVEVILGPLRESLKTFKEGKVSEEWLQVLNEQVKKALRGGIESFLWFVLPGGKSDRFAFMIESD